MNRIERRVRNMINPYSTAFATWWCYSTRYWRLPRVIRGNRAGARPGLPLAFVFIDDQSAPGQPSTLTNSPTRPSETTRDIEDSTSLALLVSKMDQHARDN